MKRLCLAAALILSLGACDRKPVPVPASTPVTGKVLRRPLTDQVRIAIANLEKEAHVLNLAGKSAAAAEKQERILYYYREFGHRLEAGRISMTIGFHYGNHDGPAKGAGYIVAAYVAGREEGSQAGETLRREALEALHALALNLVEKGEVDQARQCYTPLIGYLERAGSHAKAELGQAYHNLGWVLADSGDYRPAAATYEKALAIREKTAKPYDVAWSLNNLGHTWIKAGNFDKAASYLYRALVLLRTNPFADVSKKVLDNIEILSVDAGKAEKHDVASANDERLLREARSTIARYRVRRILHRLHGSYKALSKTKNALETVDRLIGMERQWKNPFGEARGWHTSAKMLVESGNSNLAAKSIEKALSLQRELGDRLGEAASLLIRADLEPPTQASATLDKAEAIYRETEDHRPGIVALLRARAKMERRAGRKTEADALGKKADDLAKRPPLGDLPRIDFVEQIEHRGKALASMKPTDPVIIITLEPGGWVFRDEPTGLTQRVEMRYRNRQVFFQGFLFTVFAKTVNSGELNLFLRPDERVVQTKDGRLFRGRR